MSPCRPVALSINDDDHDLDHDLDHDRHHDYDQSHRPALIPLESPLDQKRPLATISQRAQLLNLHPLRQLALTK